LVNDLNKKNSLTVKDYIKVFCDCFEQNDAFQIFRNFNIESDRMYVAIRFNRHGNSFYIERQVNIEEVDEVYELGLELNLNIPFEEIVRIERYEIERDLMGDFFIEYEGEGPFYDKRYTHFSDYVKNVLSSDIAEFTDLYPDNICIILNANH
jgi:hypothetical protein